MFEIMKKPNPLNRKQLEHPKDQKSNWNGDRIRPGKDQGFASSRQSQGLKVVHGTRQPSGVKPPFQSAAHSIHGERASMAYTPGRGPSRAQKLADDRKTREANQKPLSDRQKRLKRGK